MSMEEDIIDALQNRKKIVLTASDVAALVDVHRTTALDRLHGLEDAGKVASIEVGGQGIGWYLPEDIGRLSPETGDLADQMVIPTYLEYLYKPVDQRGRVTIHVDHAHKTLTLALMDPTAMRTVSVDEWNYANPMQYHRVREVMELEADDRGRVFVGKEYSGRKISMALLEVKD